MSAEQSVRDQPLSSLSQERVREKCTERSTREGVVELSAALNRHGAAWTEVARVEARGAGGLEQAPCESSKLDNAKLVGVWCVCGGPAEASARATNV